MRPTKHEYFIKLAEVVAIRATCVRRAVGCVLVNERGHILATGYNGNAAGLPHCNEGHPCEGATAPSGESLDLCEAIHAEQNALLQCQDVQQIHTCYSTTAPCIHCTKLLLNTSCKQLVFSKSYSHDEQAQKLWLQAGRSWVWKPFNILD